MGIRNDNVALDAGIEASKIRGIQQVNHGRTLYSVHPDDPQKAEFISSRPSGRVFVGVQAAVTGSKRGDLILVLPGPDGANGKAIGYDETVTITRGTEGITIQGLGPRGSVYIEPDTAGAEGMEVRARDITLVNLGVAGDGASDYGIRVFGERFRAYGCKFEGPDAPGAACILGPGTVAQVDTAKTHGNGADSLFDDCEFGWTGMGLRLQSSDYGAVTQARIRESLFHNCVTACLGENDVGAIGVCRDLWVQDSVFGNQEDGTAPTDYVDVDSVGSKGLFTGNRFATATNASGVLQIAAGVMWMGNSTEAGWSTARPA
jgi:hypothetical protein